MKLAMIESLRTCEVWCCCGKKLVIHNDKKTIIKNKLLVINDREGTIEIKCSECSKITVITHSNQFPLTAKKSFRDKEAELLRNLSVVSRLSLFALMKLVRSLVRFLGFSQDRASLRTVTTGDERNMKTSDHKMSGGGAAMTQRQARKSKHGLRRPATRISQSGYIVTPDESLMGENHD